LKRRDSIGSVKKSQFQRALLVRIGKRGENRRRKQRKKKGDNKR
jgi:hypothetical protein